MIRMLNVKYVWNTADMTEMLNNGSCIARTRYCDKINSTIYNADKTVKV
jgi:hypothetical protein